jgi:hypothetical protein
VTTAPLPSASPILSAPTPASCLLFIRTSIKGAKGSGHGA